MSRRKQGIIPKRTDGGEETEEIVKNGDHSLADTAKGESLSLQMLNECKKCLCEYSEKCHTDELGKLSRHNFEMKTDRFLCCASDQKQQLMVKLETYRLG